MKKTTLRVVRRDGTAPSDAAAFARIGAGDLGALGEVFDRHSRALVAFVRRAHPNGDAEDVVQTTFVRALGLANMFDPTAESARPWLFGIASRVMMEERRAFARLARAVARLRNGTPACTSIETATTDVDRALARLSTPKRIVLLLAEVEGYRCEEIATMLGVPVGTVWTRLHHARKDVRRYLEHEEATEVRS